MEFNKESRTTNAKRNIVSAFVNKFIIIILTFISRKMFIEYIGIEYLGISGLFANILTILSMADLGIGTAMNVSLYKPIAENNRNKVSALVGYFKKIYRIIAVVIICIGILIMPFLKYLINLENDIPHLYIYYLVFLFKTALSYVCIYKSSIVRADQKAYIINRVEIYTSILKLILQLMTIIIWRNYLLYILIDALFVLVFNLIISFIADKKYSFLSEKNNLEKDEIQELHKDIFSVSLYKVSYGLLSGTDNILISIFCGTILVGVYSNYFAITNTIETFIALIFSSVTASVGNMVVTSGSEHKYRVFRVLQMFSFWICALITVCLLFLTQDFITLWFGKEYLLNNYTLMAIVVNKYFSTSMRPVWSYRESTGMYRQIRYIMLCTAILNILLSVVGGYLFGITGIIFATALSKLLTYFWYEPRLLFKNIFDIRAYKYYTNYFFNVLLTCICIVLGYFLMSIFNHITWTSLIVKAVLCALLVTSIYFVSLRKTDEFKILYKKILKRN